MIRAAAIACVALAFGGVAFAQAPLEAWYTPVSAPSCVSGDSVVQTACLAAYSAQMAWRSDQRSLDAALPNEALQWLSGVFVFAVGLALGRSVAVI